MKAKAVLATAIVVSTLMTATTFGAVGVKKTSGKYNENAIAINVETNGFANGLVIEISRKKNFSKNVIRISSKLSKISTNVSPDSKQAVMAGSANGYSMEANYARTGNWPGIVSGYWSSGKGIESAVLFGRFNNDKSEFTAYVESSKKFKKGTKLYVRVTPVNGRRLGKKGKVAKLKRSSSDPTRASVNYEYSVDGNGHGVGYFDGVVYSKSVGSYDLTNVPDRDLGDLWSIAAPSVSDS